MVVSIRALGTGGRTFSGRTRKEAKAKAEAFRGRRTTSLRKKRSRGGQLTRQEESDIQRQERSEERKLRDELQEAKKRLPKDEFRRFQERKVQELQARRFPKDTRLVGEGLVGKVGPGGQVLLVRQLTPIEQRRRESLRAGFISIDPRARRRVDIGQQLALRKAIPITTRGIPLGEEVRLRRREVTPTPEPTTLQRVVGAVVRPVPLPRPVERGIRERFERLRGIERADVEEFRTIVRESRLPQPIKDVLVRQVGVAGQVGEVVTDISQTFLTDIRRPIVPLTVGVFGVAGRVVTRVPVVGRAAARAGEALLLGGFIGEETAQVILERKRVGEVLGTVAALGVAARITEPLVTLPGRIRGKVREARLRREAAALERGAMLEEPFKLVQLEETIGVQRDLFGRPVPEVRVRRALRELDVSKVGFGIEKNPLIPVSERALPIPTGQRRLAEDVILGVSRITREVRPVRVVERQPFIFEPRVGRFVEFAPGGEFGLVTIPPTRPSRLPKVDVFDISVQTLLARPEPPSRIFRRLPPPERLPPPRVTEPRRFGRGVEAITFRPTTTQELLFTGRPVQETFLAPPEPLPTIPRLRRLNLLLGPGLRLREAERVRERVSLLEISAVSLIGREALRLDVRPEQRVDIFAEVKPRVLPREALDVRQIQVQDIGQVTVPITPVAPFPALPPPLLEITPPPERPIPPPPPPALLLGLPRARERRRRREALLEPFKQPKEFVPSVAAFTFRIFGEPREERLFAGFEFRPIPKRLRGLL